MDNFYDVTVDNKALKHHCETLQVGLPYKFEHAFTKIDFKLSMFESSWFVEQ